MASNESLQARFSKDDESGKKLVDSLNQALSAIANGTEVNDPQAIEFKRQIENGNLPTYPEFDLEKERIIYKWVSQNRDALNAVFAELRFFRRRN